MDKEVVVHIYNGMLLSQTDIEIMPFVATRTDPEIIIPTEVSQKEKDKYHMVALICGLLKYDTNELICEIERLTALIYERERLTESLSGGETCGCQAWGWGGKEQWIRSLGLAGANPYTRNG